MLPRSFFLAIGMVFALGIVHAQAVTTPSSQQAAHAAYLAGKYADAIPLYATYLANPPSGATATLGMTRYELADCEVHTQQYADAAKLLQVILNDKKTGADLWAQAQKLQKQVVITLQTNAQTAATRAKAAATPEAAAALLTGAEADYDALITACAQSADGYAAATGLSDLYSAQNRGDDLTALRARIAAWPESVQSLTWLADSYGTPKTPDACAADAALLTRLRTLAPKDTRQTLWGYRLAVCLEGEGKKGEALPLYQQAADDTTLDPQVRLNALRAVAKASPSNGDAAKAAAVRQQIYALAAQSGDVSTARNVFMDYFDGALSRDDLASLAAEIENLVKLKVLSATDAAHMLTLAASRRLQHGEQAQRQALQNAVTTPAEAVALRGQAEGDYRAVLTNCPGSDEALTAVTWLLDLYRIEDRGSEAKGLLASVESAESTTATLSWLANYETVLNTPASLAKAADALTRLIALAPTDKQQALWDYRLGEIYDAQSKATEAQTAYVACAKATPDTPLGRAAAVHLPPTTGGTP